MENKKETLTAAKNRNASSSLLKKPAFMSEKNQKNWDVRYMPVRLPSGVR